MQRPHDSLFEKNPTFADLWPRLDKRVSESLQSPDDARIRKELDQASQRWTKLKIVWDEMQLLLAEKKNRDFVDSLRLHVEKARSQETFAKELSVFAIPETHTFLPIPSNIEGRLEILSDMLAISLNGKLEIFEKVETPETHGIDLATLKETRDCQIAEYEVANSDLIRQVGLTMTQIYREAAITLTNHTHHLENVKHGSVDRFTNTFLKYHEVASKALLEKVDRAIDTSVGIVYTTEFKRALENHSREIERELPQLEDRLRQTNSEIRKYEEARTAEYVDAIEEYQRLQGAIDQAERDIDKLLHYKAEK